MTEFAQNGAIRVVVDNWVRIKPEERRTLLQGFAKLFPVTYGRFEAEHFDHLARQATPDTLPLDVQGHLFMSVTPGGFSAEQVITVLEIAANSFQG